MCCADLSRHPHALPCLYARLCWPAAGDLWLLSADDNSTLLDAVMESFRIHDRAVSAGLLPL